MTEPFLEHAFWEWIARFPSFMGISFARMSALVAGVLLLMGGGVSFWERRVRILPAIVVGLAGMTLVVLAMDTETLNQIMRSSFLSRVRFLLGFLSVCVLAITFETIRIDRLRERYALLWLGTGGMVLLAALFPQSIDFLTHILGVQYVTAVVAVVFTFLLLVAFHFSIALSSLEDDRAQIAQRCALLELRLAKVENQLGLAPVPASLSEINLLPETTSEQREMRGVFAATLAVMGFSVLMMGWTMSKTGLDWISGVPALFCWVQMLVAVFCWANIRRGAHTASAFLCVLTLAGMPAWLLGVWRADPGVAMAAQLLSAFFLLDRKNLMLAGWMMGAGIFLDSRALLFLPAFVLVGFQRGRGRPLVKNLGALCFGPVVLLLWKRVSGFGDFAAFEWPAPPVEHPGFAQLGFMFIGLLVIGLTGFCRPKGPSVPEHASRHQPWPLVLGLLAAWGLWFWPDRGRSLTAVLPALPFLVLPLSEWSMRVIRVRGWLMMAVLITFFQVVYAYQFGVN